MKPLDLADIQGIVLFAYASLPHARYVHVSWPDGSQPSTWLREIQHEVNASRLLVAFRCRRIASPIPTQF